VKKKGQENKRPYKIVPRPRGKGQGGEKKKEKNPAREELKLLPWKDKKATEEFVFGVDARDPFFGGEEFF